MIVDAKLASVAAALLTAIGQDAAMSGRYRDMMTLADIVRALNSALDRGGFERSRVCA